jgi:hypothetical protein
LGFDERSKRRRSALVRDIMEGAEDLAGAAKVTVDDAVAALAKAEPRSGPLRPPVVTSAGERVPATGAAPPTSPAPGDVVSTAVVLGVFAAKGAEFVYDFAATRFQALVKSWRKGSPT